MTHTRVLALDTSTKSQVLALLDGDDVVARRMSRVRTNHSETLLRNIDDMMTQARWKSTDLDLCAVGLGPGTFTGLRVGLATAKALAVGSNADLVGVSSLAATARPVSALFEGAVFALCDARRGEVYCARYDVGPGRFECTFEARALAADAVIELVEAVDGPAVMVGNGTRAFDDLAVYDAPHVTRLGQPWDGPSSVSVGLLGRAEVAAHGCANIESLEPNYVRPSDAELNFGPPDATNSSLT